MVSSIGVICYYIFREPLTLEDKEPNGTLTGFFMFFSTVLFALEAIGVVSTLIFQIDSTLILVDQIFDFF